jgi:hypothetical protein
LVEIKTRKGKNMKKKFQKINLQNVKNMPPESIIADDEITGFIVKSSKKKKDT